MCGGSHGAWEIRSEKGKRRIFLKKLEKAEETEYDRTKWMYHSKKWKKWFHMGKLPPIIALDLDGTAFAGDHKTITPATRQALEKFAARGVQIVPVTGRCEGIVTLDFFPAIRYIITCNGAMIRDRLTGEVLYDDPIPRDNLLRAWKIIGQYPGVIAQLFVNGEIVLEQRFYDQWESCTRVLPIHHLPYLQAGRAIVVDSIGEYIRTTDLHISKINLPGKSLESCPELLDRLCELDLFDISSDGLNLEATNKDCTKGKGLLWLCEYLHVSSAEVAAFGDGHNDIPMLCAVGYGVAMGNAKPDTRQAAAYCTGTNLEDGIAQFLYEQWGSEL